MPEAVLALAQLLGTLLEDRTGKALVCAVTSADTDYRVVLGGHCEEGCTDSTV